MFSFTRFFAVAILSTAVLAGCSKSPEQRAKNHLERAKEFVANKDDVRARVEYRNAVQFNNNLTEAWRGLKDLDDRTRNWAGVVAASKRIAELDEKDVEARLTLARLSLVAKKLDDALKYANEAVEIDPKNAKALATRSLVFLRLQDNKAAVQEAHKVLALDSANTEAIIVLAAEKLSRGDTKGALAELKDLSSSGQNDLGATMLRIRIYESQKDLAGIEAELKKLVELNPDQVAYKRELVRFYLANKRPEDAEKLIRSVAEANPDDPAAGLNVVRLVGQLRGVDAGREELLTAIKNSKDNATYKIALAELDFSQGRFDAAKADLEALIKDRAKSPAATAARLKLAEFHAARRDYNAAVELANQVLAEDARNVAALRLRAGSKIELGELEGAINDARAALNDQPRSPDLLSLLAVAYERGGQIELADKQLADAMRSSNYDPRYGLGYVTFLNRRGLQSHAENVLTELASRTPNNANVLATFAQLKLSRKDWAGAQELADRIKALGQATGTAAEIEAATLVGQNKFAEGMNVLEEVQRANPNAQRPIASMVQAYLRAGQPDKAEEFLNSVVKANASNAEAYVMLGLTSLAKKKPEEAVDRFKKAIDVQPTSPIGYRALADEYVRLGKFDDAMQVIDTGLKQVANDFALRQTKAGILERKADFNGAIALYEDLLKEQPGSMVLANNYASLVSDHRTDKESLDKAHAAALALVKADVPHFKDTLGWLYYLRGDYKNAQVLLEQAAKALPNLSLVRYHLGMAYKAAGERDKAREELTKAAELDPGPLKSRIQAALQELSKGAG